LREFVKSLLITNSRKIHVEELFTGNDLKIHDSKEISIKKILCQKKFEIYNSTVYISELRTNKLETNNSYVHISDMKGEGFSLSVNNSRIFWRGNGLSPAYVKSMNKCILLGDVSIKINELESAENSYIECKQNLNLSVDINDIDKINNLILKSRKSEVNIGDLTIKGHRVKMNINKNTIIISQNVKNSSGKLPHIIVNKELTKSSDNTYYINCNGKLLKIIINDVEIYRMDLSKIN